MKTNQLIRSLALFSICGVTVSLSSGVNQPYEKEMIEAIKALNAARTLVDGYQITGISDRNRPGIGLDRKRFVEVGQSVDADGKTVLTAIEPEPSPTAAAPRWSSHSSGRAASCSR